MPESIRDITRGDNPALLSNSHRTSLLRLVSFERSLDILSIPSAKAIDRKLHGLSISQGLYLEWEGRDDITDFNVLAYAHGAATEVSTPVGHQRLDDYTKFIQAILKSEAGVIAQNRKGFDEAEFLFKDLLRRHTAIPLGGRRLDLQTLKEEISQLYALLPEDEANDILYRRLTPRELDKDGFKQWINQRRVLLSWNTN